MGIDAPHATSLPGPDPDPGVRFAVSEIPQGVKAARVARPSRECAMQ